MMESTPLPKVVLYCHNRYGLGHIVRSIRIATSLLASGRFTPILLTGCSKLESLTIPEGIAVHRLTPVPADEWAPDHFDILNERMAQIKTCLQQVRPQVFLVDTLPFGYHNELKPGLQEAAAAGASCVLGLPYILPNWPDLLRNPASRALLATYQLGLLYSDELLANQLGDCPFPVQQIGLIAGGELRPSSPTSKTILVLNGGGAGSDALLALVLRATAGLRQQGFHVRFVMGPLAQVPPLLALAAGEDNLTLIPECPMETAIGDARLVIARCGYNTANGLMRAAIPVIFVPFPIQEQVDRAARMTAEHNVQLVDISALDATEQLEHGIQLALEQPHEPRTQWPDPNGAARVLESLTTLFAEHQLTKI